MEFGLSNILQILGSLAFFIFGMKMMSEGIQRAAGNQLRSILHKMTRNRFTGVLTGFFTTALVQSSSATTVMTVSFVNAGLVTLTQSVGIMMGANIGTTVTAWIISMVGQVDLGVLSIPLFALAVPLIFLNRGTSKYWGEFIVGFGILFLSINFLQGAIPSFGDNPEMLRSLEKYTNYGILSRILFVFVGSIIAVILQSSTAAMAITMALCYKGWLPLDIGASMVLGENIGTTATAEIASLVGNTAARRSARIHSIFNIIGVIWMIILLPYFIPIISDFVDNFSGLFEGHFTSNDSLSQANRNTTFTLAAFHTVFNVLNVLFLLGFARYLVIAAEWSVKDIEDDTDKTRLKFISSSIRTPELATIELMKETSHFGQIVSEMNKFTRELINSRENKERKKRYKKLRNYEEISDRIEIEITEYITKLSSQEITKDTSIQLRSILNICSELERIGDIYYQVSLVLIDKNESNIYFLPNQRNSINEMLDLLGEAFKIMVSNLDVSNYKLISKEQAYAKEKEINILRDNLRNDNLNQIGKDGYNIKSAMVYNNVFNSLEKIGDHIYNISEAVVGEI